MRFRTRLLAVSLATLALGLGLLLVLGNVLLAGTVDGDTSRLLATRADAQIAALSVTPAGVSVRHAVNDETLDANAWIFDRGRLIERPAGVPAALDRVAVSLGAARGARRYGRTGRRALAQRPSASRGVRESRYRRDRRRGLDRTVPRPPAQGAGRLAGGRGCSFSSAVRSRSGARCTARLTRSGG